MAGVLIKGTQGQTHIEGRWVKPSTSHLQAKQRGLEYIPPSQLSEGTNPDNTLILDL